MAKHLPAERVVQAAQALSATNNALFADFLILKYHGISPGNPVVLTNTSTSPGIELLMAVRHADGRPILPDKPYLNPFAQSSSWRVAGYARSGPQSSIDRGNLSRIAVKGGGLPATATLKPDYIALMTPSLLSRKRLNAPRIPFGEIAIWAARANEFSDLDNATTLETWFLDEFHINPEEREAFFIGDVTPEDPFAPGPPDLDRLADLILQAFPFERDVPRAIQDEGAADAAAEEAAFELPADLLDQICGELVIPNVTVRQLITLVRMGKNVILTGPPGTGKSTLAVRLARAAAEDAARPPEERAFELPLSSGFLPTTATADWSTFDTIGGYMPSTDGNTLEFREGLFLQAIRENRWLLIDELNRADADKAFGQLFSVLSGQEVDLPFRAEASGTKNLSIRRDPHSVASRHDAGEGDYVIGSDWRIIATMNTFDRNHLFQLSAAFVRRFAVVNVPVPTVAELEGWLQARNLDGWVLERIRKLVVLLEGERPLGPAIIEDVTDYVGRRLPTIPGVEAAFAAEALLPAEIDIPTELPADPPNRELEALAPPAPPVNEDPFIEAVIAFILPQMDGLDVSALGRLKLGLRNVVSKASSGELDRQFRSLFRA